MDETIKRAKEQFLAHGLLVTADEKKHGKCVQNIAKKLNHGK